MDEGQAQEPVTTPATRKKKGGLLKTLVLVMLLVLVAGGGGAWWWMRGESASAQEPAIETRGLVSLEPFLVNLTDAGGNRFLKVKVGLVVETAEAAKHIEDTPVISMHLRSAILEILTQQSAPELVTPEGKAALKKTIEERTSALLKTQKVLDVLFSEFVVQF